MDAVQKADSGHPGMPMGMADVATVLFTRFLKFDAAHPDWPDRDRFVLSAGHGSMLLYALLYLTGYPEMTLEELKQLPPARLAHAGAPGIWPCAGHRNDHRSSRPGSRQCRRHGARRAAAQPPLWRRHRQPLHLLRGGRRLPDGGHQPRGDLPCRPPQARPAHRAVRRQPDLDRRSDQPCRLRRPDRALQGLGLAYGPRQRPRSGSRRLGHRECAGRHRPAIADRLPHHHRLWRAEQGRHRRDPRFAARRGGDQGRAREAALAASTLRGAEAGPRQLARRRHAAPRRL